MKETKSNDSEENNYQTFKKQNKTLSEQVYNLFLKKQYKKLDQSHDLGNKNWLVVKQIIIIPIVIFMFISCVVGIIYPSQIDLLFTKLSNKNLLIQKIFIPILLVGYYIYGAKDYIQNKTSIKNNYKNNIFDANQTVKLLVIILSACILYNVINIFGLIIVLIGILFNERIKDIYNTRFPVIVILLTIFIIITCIWGSVKHNVYLLDSSILSYLLFIVITSKSNNTLNELQLVSL